MDFAIYTYGHIDAAFNTLNAIAMITKSEHWDSIIQFFSVIGLTCGVFMTAATGGALRNYLLRLAQIVVIVNVLLTPKTHLWIVDHVSKQKEKVDNLPIGFVIPIGIVESIGNQLTKIMEQAFRSVKSFNYTDYGPMFGASLVHEMKNLKLQDPTFTHNMDQFLDRCVLTTAAIGKDFTFDDIFKSSDIWKDIKPKMKNGIREVTIINASGAKEQMGCKSAAALLEKSFRDERMIISKLYSFTNFGLAHTGSSYTPFRAKQPSMNSFFQSNLQKVFANYFGLNQGGSEILRQLLLMNAFSKYGDYGTVRAMQNQETSWQITGRLANHTIPMLLTVMKCMLYGIFPFIMLAMVLSGSMQQLRSYMIFVASFQVWPALEAILNMIIDTYSAENFAALSHSAVSLSSFSNVGSLADKIVGVASMLQLSVPFLSLGVVRGSFESFNHMASYIQSSITAAAAAGSAEVISGNRSFDNVSIGNVSGFKTDLNSSYAAGASSYQSADGSIVNTTSDGKSIYRMGQGFTKHATDFKAMLRAASLSEVSDALSEHQSIAQGLSTNLAKSEAKTIDTAAEMIQSIHDHASKGYSNSQLNQITNSKDYSQIVAKALDLQANHGMTKEEAFRAATRGYAGLNIGKSGSLNILGAVFGVGGEAGIESSGEQSGSSSSHAGISQNNSSSSSQNVTDHQGTIFNRSQEETLMHQLGVSKDQINRFNESMNETRSLQDQLHVEQNQVQSLQATQQRIVSLGGSYEQDVTNEVIAETTRQMQTINKEITEYDVIMGLDSGDWMITGVANRALNKIQTEFNKSLGINIDIPSKSNFENNSNNSYQSSAKNLKDRHNASITPITNYDADTQYNNIISNKNTTSTNFKNSYEEQTQNTNNQQNAINTSLSSAQGLHNEKAKNSQVGNWFYNDSNNFLQNEETRKQNDDSKREKELDNTISILKKLHESGM